MRFHLGNYSISAPAYLSGFRVGAIVALLSLLAVLACFSVRSDGLGLAPGGECSIPLGAKVPGSTLVVIRNFAFEPAEVRVKAGATVTWVNCSAASDAGHTTTSDGTGWNSPTFVRGEAFSFTFGQAGRMPYHCEPHPFMKGTVVVE